MASVEIDKLDDGRYIVTIKETYFVFFTRIKSKKIYNTIQDIHSISIPFGTIRYGPGVPCNIRNRCSKK